MALEAMDPVVDDYKNSLAELTNCSKPMISMLSMLAEDLKDSKAPAIVRCVEQRLHEVSAHQKLPILYLMDSICKNVGIVYVKLFTQNIVSNFCNVFEKVDLKTRTSLLKLRKTWDSIFPDKKLDAIDRRIRTKLDPNWPISSTLKSDVGSVSQLNQMNENGSQSRKRSHLTESQNIISQKSRYSNHRFSQSPTQIRRHYLDQRQSSHSTGAVDLNYVGHQSADPLHVIQSSVKSHSSPLMPTSVRFGIQSPASTSIPAPHVLYPSHMDPNVGTTTGLLREMSNEYNSMSELRQQVIERQFPALTSDRDYRRDLCRTPETVWFDSDSTGAHTLTLNGQLRVGVNDERSNDFYTTTTSETNATSSRKTTTFESCLINTLFPKIIGNETSLPSDPPILLSSDSLKLKRPSVVSALYRGIQCTNCSLRFDNSDRQIVGQKSQYSLHLDWHFRQNRRDKARDFESKRRDWYYSLDLWVQFTQVTDTEDIMRPAIEDKVEELPVLIAIAEKDESLNCCGVCAERFDQNWDEEEEEWVLKNAVKHNHILYHPLCLNDFIVQNERLEQELNERLDISDPNISDESTNTALKAELVRSDTNFDDLLLQDLSESVVVKSDVNMNEMNETEDMSEEPVFNDKAIDSEECLNFVQKLNHQLVYTSGLMAKEESNDGTTVPEELFESEMNLMSLEMDFKSESKVIVSGHEVSNLCNIM